MKNLFTLSLGLLVSAAIAMEPAAPAPVAKEATEQIAQVAQDAAKTVTENAAKAAETVSTAAKTVVQKASDACQDKHGIIHSMQHLFQDGKSFAGAQWAQVTKTAATLKSNGWKALNKNEKIGVAVAGTAIVATTAYVIYKLYNAATKTDKKSKVQVNVRQVRC